MNGVFDKKTKTVYIDTGERHKGKSAVLGAIFLFICVFAGVFGILSALADSFRFEISRAWIALEILKYLLFFTAVYFVPSKLFTFIMLAGGAVALGIYVWLNLYDVIFSARAALNWCLFRISEAGYSIGAMLDRDLARATPHETYLIIFTFAAIILTGLFAYLLYSRKSVFFALVISVAIIFTGFFYGLIPSYFSVSLVVAFWVANFAVNIFDSDYIMRLLYKQSETPEPKLAKLRLREFKKEHKKSVKTIKAEIKELAGMPNPDENILRLERLLRQLEAYEKPGFWFMKMHGLDKIKIRRRGKRKFVHPIKAEKKKLKQALLDMEKAEKAQMTAEKKAFKSLSFSERFKTRVKANFSEKKKFFTRNGYNAMSAFAVALVITVVVQPFISPDARLNWIRDSVPHDFLNTVTRTIEDLLVGSDARVYGGFGGGMGGGDLYRPGGVRFRHVPILEIDLRNDAPRINSSAIYLRGFVGSIYTGQRWIEADRRYIDEFNELMRGGLFGRYRPERFFRYFMNFMHDDTRTPRARRNVELVQDIITVQHVVVGGRLAFIPHFMTEFGSRDFNLRRMADLNVHVTNSILRRPRYTVQFYSTDNVLDRDSEDAVNNMRVYLGRYMELFTDIGFWPFAQIEQRFPGSRLVSADQVGELSAAAAERFVGPNALTFTFQAVEDYIIIEHFIAPNGAYLPHSPNSVLIPVEYAYEVQEIRAGSRFRNDNFVPVPFIFAEMAYYNFVREHFLQLPEYYDEPERAAELEAVARHARLITRGLECAFDIALALEHYLSHSFQYTLNPRSPQNRDADFVYSFLFDVQEGYCSYYATAMTVMLRTLGIPARHVEGFLVETRRISRDEAGNPAANVVLDSDAHAWVEVYLRGAGWIPFEPTASAEIEQDEPAVPERRPAPAFPLDGEYRDPDWGMAAYCEYCGEDWWYCECWLNGLAAPTDAGDDGAGFIPAVLALLAAAATLIVFYMINRVINSKRFKYFKTAATNAAVIRMLEYIMRFLKLCGFAIQSDEGLIDFARRISQSFPMMRSDGWVSLMRIMQKARYSKHEITEQEREFAYNFIGELRGECLQHLKFGLKFRLRFVQFVI